MNIAQATVLLSIALILAGSGFLHAKGPYFDYETFHSLTALVPEVKNPRPIGGTTETGYQTWAKGEMRLTEPNQYRAEADFDGNGKLNVALPFKSERGFHLLIAEGSGAAWQRKAFFDIAQESAVSWDGKILSLEPQIYVRWDGRRYRIERGHLAAYVYGYSESDLQQVLLKITYIGAQRESVDGLLLLTHQGSPNLAAFKPHRRRGIFYANDDGLNIKYLTLSTGRMRDVIKALLEPPWLDQATKRTDAQATQYSVTLVDTGSPHQPNPFEVLLSQDELRSFLHSAAQSIEPADPSAAKVLRAYP